MLFKLPLDEANFDRKVKVLRSYGEYYSKKISLNFCYMPEHVRTQHLPLMRKEHFLWVAVDDYDAVLI